VTVTPPLVGRLALMALFGVILQVAVISQVEVFGVPADVTPLLVGSIGLLLGSTAGASFGFGVGLLLDLGLMQTLGVSSLLLVTVGYGAGRLRELRDPAHSLVPMAVGAAAAAIVSVGYTILQFLIGATVPLSILLVRDVLLAIVLATLLSLPVYALVRRMLLSFLPDDPRRRRRRAYTTGGLSPLSRA
jgi:rod shape-determining protein MreD